MAAVGLTASACSALARLPAQPTVSANGQLTVGGRLGQFSNQEIPVGGLYYPTTIEPEIVNENSLLLTEATLVGQQKNRTFALFGGTNVTCNSAAAGSTQYIVNNTYANRFSCAACKNGYAALDQAGAATLVAKVVSVKLQDGTDLVPYSGATESNNKIVITLDRSINPNAATTKIRLYGSMTMDSSVHIGQNIGTGSASNQGKLLELGQNILSLGGNSICVGNGIFNNKNRCAIFGSNQINNQQGAFLAGEGHDTTNGKTGVAAVGTYSSIGATTALAIGDGTSNTARSNIFEVCDNSGQTEVVMKSQNGTAYKLTVDNSGNLTVSAI